MLGAIAGDVVGSVHEFEGTRTKDFPLFASESRFTDDSVLTVAVARWLLEGGDLVDHFHQLYAAYPYATYGLRFRAWAEARSRAPYGSWGNGSAMRVSPVGFAFDTLAETLAAAGASAAVTHDHPEGIKGAEATAAAIFLARRTKDKDEIRVRLETEFGYDLSTPLAAIRPDYRFDESCAGTVPQALRSVLESTDFEDALRNAVSLGGDADTLACIAGGVAEAYYGGIPDAIARPVLARLDPPLRRVVTMFRERHGLTDASPA